jgi:hypothetical protein
MQPMQHNKIEQRLNAAKSYSSIGIQTRYARKQNREQRDDKKTRPKQTHERWPCIRRMQPRQHHKSQCAASSERSDTKLETLRGDTQGEAERVGTSRCDEKASDDRRKCGLTPLFTPPLDLDESWSRRSLVTPGHHGQR